MGASGLSCLWLLCPPRSYSHHDQLEIFLSFLTKEIYNLGVITLEDICDQQYEERGGFEMMLVNKNITKLLAFIALLWVCALIFPLKNVYAIDRNNWQSELIDDAKVSWLTIPGTHDTATFNVECASSSGSVPSSYVESATTCQSMTIEEQLTAGLRVFDLRYKWENEKFYLYHGENDLACKCKDSDGAHLDLATVLQKFKTFLDAHENEFIIVNIQKESGDYNNEELDKVKSAYGVVNRTDDTTVGQVRGKIVDGSAFMQQYSTGTSPYNRWEGSVDEKIDDLKTVFTAAPSIDKHSSSTVSQQCIFTNLSWRAQNLTTWPKDYAEQVHAKFFGTNPFDSYGQRAYGAILYDFPTSTMIDWTISANDWAKAINCTFKFNSCGGSTVADSTVKEGKLVARPDDPLRAGYTFAGWYKDSKYNAEWNFLTDKAKDATTTLYAKWTENVQKQTMWRLYNKWTGEHFYTSDSDEQKGLVKVGWTDEGVGWYAPSTSSKPVYRFYNPYVEGGDHHYTMSADEKEECVKAGWTYEGIGWYSNENEEVSLYRQYNPYATVGTHNYTTSKSENDDLVSKGWQDEGVAWYGVK